MSSLVGWKVEAHQEKRYDELAAKIDELCVGSPPAGRPLMTLEEVAEFLSIWKQESYDAKDPFVKYCWEGINAGDNGVLFK